MVVHVSEPNGQPCLQVKREAEVNDHAGPPRVVEIGFQVELSVGRVESAAFCFAFPGGFRSGPPTGRSARRRRRLRLGRGRACLDGHRAIRRLVNDDLYLKGARIRGALCGIPALNPASHIPEVCPVEPVRDVDWSLLPLHDRFDGEAQQQHTAGGRSHRAARDEGLSCRSASPCSCCAPWRHRAEHAARHPIAFPSARKPPQRRRGRAKRRRRRARLRSRHAGQCSAFFRLRQVAARDVDAVPCRVREGDNARGVLLHPTRSRPVSRAIPLGTQRLLPSAHPTASHPKHVARPAGVHELRRANGSGGGT
jgi:hypothetical protein